MGRCRTFLNLSWLHCATLRSTAVVSGHVDHRIYRFYFDDASRGVADEDEFFRKFGSGPGSMDLSSSRFEIRPDSFNDTDSLMDGAGLWDYPEEYRLLGEHIPPRVGHRVRTSPYLRVSRVLALAAGAMRRGARDGAS